MEIRTDCSRRDFLRDMALLAGGSAAIASGMPVLAGEAAPADLVVVSGEDPEAMVKKAIAELGGMKKFVSKGDVVVIKPNIGWDRKPDTGANTNPDLVVALIEMAFDAGAKEVKVFDRPVQDAKKCYESSGIPEAAKKAGAKVSSHTELQTAEIPIRDGVYLKKSLLWKDALDCDCYINVPVAKHHGQTQLTMAMKNHLGLTADDRKIWHKSLDQAIADFASGFKPKLNVLDAYRIVVRNGPKGGNPQDVEMAKKCIVGVNQASMDAYGTTLFGKKPSEIRHIAMAGALGIGEIDLAKLKIAQVSA